jgi:class 3 adenylate cyclase
LDAVEVCINGGTTYWSAQPTEVKPLDEEPPVHVKFLGDGALYVWRLPEDPERALRLKVYLCNRLTNLRAGFRHVKERAGEDVPVLKVPSAIRIGIAGGTIYELSKTDGDKEYIGFPINLASRLQSYCPPLGFIASAHIVLANELIEKHKYKKVVATRVRGFDEQLVLVNESAYEELDASVKSQLFRPHNGS